MKQRSQIITCIIILSSLFLPIPEVFSQDVGEAAPDFTLETLEGTSFTLSDYDGKVVFIFLFGYECPHCLANGNNTETGIYDKFKSDNNFVAIGVDTWNGNESGVQSFKTATGISYPLCLNGSDLERTYATTYDRMIVIDREGIIRFKSTQNSIEEVVSTAASEIDTLLTEIEATGRGSLHPAAERNFEIYPVPALDRIYISYGPMDTGDMMISIINSSGNVLLHGMAASFISGNDLLEIPVLHLKGGIYFVQLRIGEKKMTRMFTVVR